MKLTRPVNDNRCVICSGSHKASMDMPDTDPADHAKHKGVVHPLLDPGDVCAVTLSRILLSALAIERYSCC